MYANGVKAYHEENWSRTVAEMQGALADYKSVSAARENCYTECNDVAAHPPPFDYANDSVSYLYHELTQQAVCRKKCKDKAVGNREESTNIQVEEVLKSGNVHNYIQLSLYNVSSHCT